MLADAFRQPAPAPMPRPPLRPDITYEDLVRLLQAIYGQKAR